MEAQTEGMYSSHYSTVKFYLALNFKCLFLKALHTYKSRFSMYVVECLSLKVIADDFYCYKQITQHIEIILQVPKYCLLTVTNVSSLPNLFAIICKQL